MLSVFGGVTREYYGGPSYDVHMASTINSSNNCNCSGNSSILFFLDFMYFQIFHLPK